MPSQALQPRAGMGRASRRPRQRKHATRKGGLDLELLKKDAEEALKAGAGLVQASLEHLSRGGLKSPITVPYTYSES